MVLHKVHAQCQSSLLNWEQSIKYHGSGGIRTHAPEETGALNQRLRPLGHATLYILVGLRISPSIYWDFLLSSIKNY